jgi:secreted Zn-dependent insulinase-like peptidase
VWRETKTVADFNFRFKEKETPMNYSSQLARKMQVGR